MGAQSSVRPIKRIEQLMGSKKNCFRHAGPDQVRDDVSGIQNMVELLDSGLRQNDKSRINSAFYEVINNCKDSIFYLGKCRQ